MDIKTLPDVETLRQLFIYDAETGDLIWRERPIEFFESNHACRAWNARFASRKAGSIRKFGGSCHIRVKIFNSRFFAHRIIWKMHYGAEPPEVIDHINGNGVDNRIPNLRKASIAQNAFNSKKRKDNTSGYKGVYFSAFAKKWSAHIRHNGNRKFIGYYETPEEAHEAYQKAAEIHHGEFRSKS